MKSNDESSSTSSSASGNSSGSLTYAAAVFKKPARNIIISLNSVNDQRLAKQKRKQQIGKNERDQQRLDLDVILSGFRKKPMCKAVVQSFLNIYNVPLEKVQTYYQFENKSGIQAYHHIVITFKDQATKSQLFKAHATLSKPVRWNQLSGDNCKENNPIIKFNNRFSKFNFGVEKQLLRFKNSEIIAEYKFKDSFYWYKQTPVSEFKVVSVEEDLDHLIDLLKYVKYF